MDKTIFDNHQGKKEEALLPEIQALVKKYQENYSFRTKGEIATIHVDEVASKVASFYEKIRRVIDWKEENLLRRSAIERVLKRNLITEIPQVKSIFNNGTSLFAEKLVKELIRGGHLPNDRIAQTKIPEVESIIKKYLHLLKNAPFSQNSLSFPLKKRVNFYNWVLAVAACEIEEVLSPPVKENALINTMTRLMSQRIRLIPENSLTEKEKLMQTYIAAHRTLFDLDDSIISYRLLKYKYPDWTLTDKSFITKTCPKIFEIWDELEKDLNHPLRKDFSNICERIDTVFTILDDIFESNQNEPEKIDKAISDRQSLKQEITKFYNQRLKTLKKRLFRLAIYSTLSVFFSNWFTFFVVEVPLAKLIYERFNLFAAVIDFIIPSLAMFILISLIRPPRAGNLDRLMEMTFRFVYTDEAKDIYEIKVNKKRNLILSLIVFLLYTLAGIFTLGGIAWIFLKARIPITSVVLDTMTIAMNVFAALIIRNKAKEISVEEKTSFGEFFLDFLSVPVAKIGSFFANKWREYNIFSVFLNVFIELPLITSIDFIESLSQFLKEQKAELH